MNVTSDQVRQKFLNFFQERGHAIISSASLVPENDPTVLFTTAGMHPLVPYLLGQPHPAGRRLVDVQKCLRTGDIEEVGDATHLTFFEMLGNWSLGDYFKKESIVWSWEFLTDSRWLGLSPDRLAATVFIGDDDAPFDRESFDLWLSVGLPAERIARLGKADNWWGPAGQTGPCGPDTEIFYWTGDEPAPAVYQPEDKRWVEIWNNVFMAYNKQSDGSFLSLAQKNVDTGMGLERILCILNQVSDVYLTDLFKNLIEKLENLSAAATARGKTYQQTPKPFRVAADHLRAAVLIIGDDKGVTPSNTDQGYVARRLLRRALRTIWLDLGIKGHHLVDLAQVIIDNLQSAYPELSRNQQRIFSALAAEEEKFAKLLDKGEAKLNKMTAISGSQAFDLFQTDGYPLELTKEIAKDKGLTLSENFNQEYATALAAHQELSRTATAGRFKGGLADHSEVTTKLHTATHLLLAALRKVLGEHVYQRGSNITAERLRLDFSHADKLTKEQLAEVEALVNQAIEKSLPVTCQEVTLDEARALGAMGVFDDKYQEKVKVYTVGQNKEIFSREICGGPHVANTAELKGFKIQKEEASSAGVRRIKAVLVE